MSKTLEIGIDVSSLPVETMHMLKDLENSWDNLNNQEQKVIDQAKNNKKKSYKINGKQEMSSINDNVSGASCTKDSDDEEGVDEVEGDFTPVISKKSRRNARKNSGSKNNNQGVPLSGTFSLGKGAKHHPWRDVVVAPRTRSKSKK